MNRLRALRESVRTGLWAVPAMCVLLALGLAQALVAVDRRLQRGGSRAWTFGAGPDGAREVLSAITTSMITFTGLVFSITIVVLQLTSSQFSPRVLRTFLRDRVTQLALGVFVATFVYAVMVLRTVRGTSDEAFVPALATTVGLALLLASVAMFVAYIHHVATTIQVSSIIDRIGRDTRAAIDRRHPAGGDRPPATAGSRSTVGARAVLPAPRAGVLVRLDEPALVQLAAEADVVLRVRLRLGEHVPEGGPLLEVTGDAQRLDAETVLRAVRLARNRTLEQDVAFGFRQLVDIADRALSPGINDPTTAVQVLDELHDCCAGSPPGRCTAGSTPTTAEGCGSRRRPSASATTSRSRWTRFSTTGPTACRCPSGCAGSSRTCRPRPGRSTARRWTIGSAALRPGRALGDPHPAAPTASRKAGCCSAGSPST